MIKRTHEEWGVLFDEAVSLESSSVWAALVEELDAEIRGHTNTLLSVSSSEAALRFAQGAVDGLSRAKLVLKAVKRQAGKSRALGGEE